MAARQRPDIGTLGALLRHVPQRFELLQALQILEREQPQLPPLGSSNDPQQEVVRLRGPLLPVFSASQITSLRLIPRLLGPLAPVRAPLLAHNRHRPPRMTLHTPVFGLGGPDGPLPYAYQEWLQQRARVKDRGTMAFLDLFQHRLLSLLYRVQLKQRIALPYKPCEKSPVYQQLQALCGLTRQPPGMPPVVPEKALISRTGLLANGRRSLAGLQSLLGHHFDVRVRIEGFQGGWRDIPDAKQTVLGQAGRNQTLGRSALCGTRAWDQQRGIRLNIGPLEPERVDSFMPHGDAHRELAALVRYYLGADLHCSLRVYLQRSERLHLGRLHGPQPGLGLGSRLNREPRDGAYCIDLELTGEGA
ncbi:type VI secretion system baseplate subunit TssG [Pseudomonas sp. 3A(2025)]